MSPPATAAYVAVGPALQVFGVNDHWGNLRQFEHWSPIRALLGCEEDLASPITAINLFWRFHKPSEGQPLPPEVLQDAVQALEELETTAAPLSRPDEGKDPIESFIHGHVALARAECHRALSPTLSEDYRSALKTAFQSLAALDGPGSERYQDRLETLPHWPYEYSAVSATCAIASSNWRAMTETMRKHLN